MRFDYEFEETNPASLSIDYSPKFDERLSIRQEKGTVYVFGNREGLLTLAKICIKLAMGPYEQGYHMHIPEDFDADNPATLCLGVEPER